MSGHYCLQSSASGVDRTVSDMDGYYEFNGLDLPTRDNRYIFVIENKSKTKARLDELELLPPVHFFRTPLLFVCLFVCLTANQPLQEPAKKICDLFSKVTKPYVSKTGVAGRHHLGVPGKITGSVESGDLPEIITAVGPYKTAHIVGCLHHGELLVGGYDGLCLLPEYFEGSFDKGVTGSMQKSWSLRPLRKTHV
ncbi:hypothetical protein THAOC_05177 [Thalassiosira oceanica]|uniref:Uncharacterized protein n=1 Tax=Thalassiosira oceanica TaxID=159749 RepID=K0T6F1_THAOC|nr:hypothetical protein THAOC_05177 [Thalassiosira oceanica]|eukprot:EJK73210.1 hypothetical protein THAOC_05177 [Thalassiosira oceanica]